jgi:hypothetical protein
MNFFSTNLRQRQGLNELNLTFPKLKNKKKKSQMQKILQENSVSVAIINNKAYWVRDNTFYTAKINEVGMIDTDNAEAIDVFSLTEREMKNLLNILDSITEK